MHVAHLTPLALLSATSALVLDMPRITTSIDHRKRPVIQARFNNWRQRGVNLIELMVGIAIGLFIVAVAGSALMVSRGISGTTSDANLIQQQAGFAFRSIGLQLRQAGSLYLNINPKNNTNTDIDLYALPVVFEAKAVSPVSDRGFTPRIDTISGTDQTLNVAYRRYQEAIFTESNSGVLMQSLSKDCLGGPQDTSDNKSFMRLESRFALNGTDLRCTSTSSNTQPIISNVANFRIRYLLQNNASLGAPNVQYVNAAGAAAAWGRVVGVEVCLVLFGNERMNLPTGSNYTDCDGTTTVDMSSATATDMNGNVLGAARAGHMHMVFRSVYQMRSQGLVGSVL